MTKVKICGLRRASDLRTAIRKGADFVGFINYTGSPRYVDLAVVAELISQSKKYSSSVKTVLVMVSDDVKEIEEACTYTKSDYVQLHTKLSAKDFNALKVKGKIKVFNVKSQLKPEDVNIYNADYYLFDAYSNNKQGGTGQVFNWEYIPKEVLQMSFIAGGLNPDKAKIILQQLSPFALDFNSGLELSPACKSKARIEKLFRRLKSSTSLDRKENK